MGILDRRRALMSKNKPETFLDTPKYYKLGGDISTSGIGAQGACFYKDAIYFCTISSDSSTQYLYKYAVATGTTSLLKTYTTLGHANSMTYVPSKNAFYVATMDANLGIAVIDDTSYEKTGNVVIVNPDTGTNSTPYAIAYDRTNNVLYNNVGSYCRVYDADGNYLRRINLSGYVSHTTEQGFETDGQYLYKCWSGSNFVDVYTVTGTFVTTLTIASSTELEELVYDWAGKFYSAHHYTTGKQQLYAELLRSFDHYINMVYTPISVWATAGGPNIGTWTKSGNNVLAVSSTSASAGWSLLAYGAGYPYGYSYLLGKKIRVSFDVKRTNGSSGRVLFSAFTTNSDPTASGSGVIYQGTKGIDVPASGSEHFEYTGVFGTDWFTPASGQEGTYIGYRVFWNAASGNACEISNIKFEVEV